MELLLAGPSVEDVAMILNNTPHIVAPSATVAFWRPTRDVGNLHGTTQ
jgi:hypothetical protein